ncbi:MAG: alpha/beta hydrolase [Hymenobacter sp.]
MAATATSALERSNVTISGATGPDKPSIVFLHGLGGDQRMWRLVAPAFEDRYQVVLLDLVGDGKGELGPYSPAIHPTLEAHAADLLDVLQALALHDAVFVGHSVGAMIGVMAALREPQRFAKMVLIAPSPRFAHAKGRASGFEPEDTYELLTAIEDAYLGWSHGLAPVTTGLHERPELVLELSNSFVRTNPEIARHFARVTLFDDSRPALPFLSIPTLIVQSAHDVIAPLAVGHYINEQLTDSRLVVVDTGGHCPQLSAPQQTLGAMDGFLHRDPVLG